VAESTELRAKLQSEVQHIAEHFEEKLVSGGKRSWPRILRFAGQSMSSISPWKVL
jgi:hypothetical protein